MTKVNLTRRAEKDLKRLSRETAKRIVDTLKGLEQNKKQLYPLTGDFKGLFKLRVGNYRAIIEKASTNILTVRFINHRKDVYR